MACGVRWNGIVKKVHGLLMYMQSYTTPAKEPTFFTAVAAASFITHQESVSFLYFHFINALCQVDVTQSHEPMPSFTTTIKKASKTTEGRKRGVSLGASNGLNFI